jgi:hypothetical protein
MAVERLSTAAKTYLSAIGAVAIYVSVDQGNPIAAGVARDLDKAIRNIRRIMSPTASIGWIAWGMDYAALTQIAQTPNLIYVNRDDGIKRALPLNELVALIELLAQARGLTLTPHSRAIERAKVYAGYLDEALEALQRDGTFSAFNRAYAVHRLERARRNESVTPFWAVMHELRALIIRSLIASPKNRLVPSSVIVEIRKQFPWFTRKAIPRKSTFRGKRR